MRRKGFFIKYLSLLRIRENLTAILISITLIFLFLKFAFKSVVLRNFIAWSEPKLPFILFISAVAISIFSLITHRKNRENGLKVAKKADKGNYNISRTLRLLYPALAIILFTFPLFQSWTTAKPSGQAVGSTIAGFVPWSDAAAYYAGAQCLLIDGKLDAWNQRRPINTTFLAVRLKLAQYDFRTTMIIQAILLGLACYWASMKVGILFGNLSGLAFFSILLAFARTFVQTTLSESLSLTFGALAFAALLHSLHKQNGRLFAFGLLLLTVALNVRAGPFFVLLCLLFWVITAFRRSKLLNFRLGSLAFLAILAGFILNSVIIYLYSGKLGLGHGNFSHLLYGLVSGGKGWTQIYLDFPEAKSLEESVQNTFIFSKSLELLKYNPLLLLAGLLRNSGISLVKFSWHIADLFFNLGISSVSSVTTSVNLLLLMKFLFSVLFFFVTFITAKNLFWSNRKDIRVSFIATGLLGILLSLPFIYPDGGKRVNAAVFPFIAAVIALPLTSWSMPLKSHETNTNKKQIFFLPVIVAVILIMAALIGPLIAKERHSNKLSEIAECDAKNKSIVALVGPGSAFLNFLPSTSSTKTFAPVVNERDFQVHPKFDKKEEVDVLVGIRAPEVLLLLYDQQHKKFAYLLGSPEIVGLNWEILHFCVEDIPGSVFTRVVNFKPVNKKLF